jgi:pyrroloquinoline quinone (PQQ) biosynthesis protein C
VTTPDDDPALRAATLALMTPLARLLVARGVPYANAEECLKIAMVDAARAAHPDGLPHRLVSRIATTTGINRREVTRLTRPEAEQPAPQQSTAAATYTRWRTSPAYADAQGRPRVLPRQGDAPSFESLARGVTQDVHPRSLLDELLRLGLASHDVDSDTVTLTLHAVPARADQARMLEFLAQNVGDHLSAAVENVLGPTPRHLERAVFADGLSHAAVAAAEAWVAEAWREMLATIVPFLERLIADEASLPASERQQRLRTGLYAYTAPDVDAPAKPLGPAGESTGDPPAVRHGARKIAPVAVAPRMSGDKPARRTADKPKTPRTRRDPP